MTEGSPIAAVRRRWWLVAAMGLAGAVLGALPEPQQVEEQATTFSATHTMLANNTEAAFSSTSAISPNQVTLLATTGEVPRRVAERIGFTGGEAVLAGQVVTNFDLASGAFTVTSDQDTAEQAAAIADAFAEETNRYIVERQDELYQQRLATSRQRLEELETALNEITFSLGTDPNNPVLLAERDAISRQYSVAFEQDREVSTTPVFLSFTTLQSAQAVPIVDRGLSTPQSRSTRAIMGLVLGTSVGVVAALLVGRLDRKIRTREQAETIMGMRARVIVPRDGGHDRDRIVVGPNRYDALSDSYRTLRNVVGVVQSSLEPTEHARVTVVVSPGQGDGKTSLAANLGAAFVEIDQPTTVVNTDFRRPRLAAAVSDHAHSSLPTSLDDVDQMELRQLLTATEVPDLTLLDLSTVDGNTGDLVWTTAQIIPELVSEMGQVVVDTSPVGATAEVLEMVPLADAIVVVVRVGHTQISAAERTIAILRDLATAPIVLVLTGIKQGRERYAEYGHRDERPAAPFRWGRRNRDAIGSPSQDQPVG